MGLNIAEIRKAKADTEETIKGLLTKFQNHTTIEVLKVKLKQKPNAAGVLEIESVEIEIKL